MTVYLEYAFLDNFTMDLLLLFCAAITLQMPFKRWRLVLGAVTGSVISLFSVFCVGVWAYVIKATCLLLMCIVSVGVGKKLFWYILLTLAYTFVTGGAIVGLFNLLNINYITENGLCYNMPVPLFVYLLAVGLVVFLCYSLWVFVRQSKSIAPFLQKVTVLLDKPHVVCGFLDSGNTVTLEGLPVCFVTKSFGGVKDFFAKKLLCGQTRQVQICTLSGSKTVAAVKTQLIVFGQSREIFLALTAEKCQTQYELLLSGAFLEGKEKNHESI